MILQYSRLVLAASQNCGALYADEAKRLIQERIDLAVWKKKTSFSRSQGIALSQSAGFVCRM